MSCFCDDEAVGEEEGEGEKAGDIPGVKSANAVVPKDDVRDDLIDSESKFGWAKEKEARGLGLSASLSPLDSVLLFTIIMTPLVLLSPSRLPNPEVPSLLLLPLEFSISVVSLSVVSIVMSLASRLSCMFVLPLLLTILTFFLRSLSPLPLLVGY